MVTLEDLQLVATLLTIGAAIFGAYRWGLYRGRQEGGSGGGAGGAGGGPGGGGGGGGGGGPGGGGGGGGGGAGAPTPPEEVLELVNELQRRTRLDEEE